MIKVIQSKSAWALLAISALGLELAALYFQYFMKLDPCVLCVYERAAVALIFLAGVTGAIKPHQPFFRLLGYLLWAGGAGWGLFLSIKHSAIQMGLLKGSASCDFVANFPSWFQLDQWIPAIFNPTGYCEDIVWEFMGLSMPQSMVVVNAIYLIVLFMALAAELKRSR